MISAVWHDPSVPRRGLTRVNLSRDLADPHARENRSQAARGSNMRFLGPSSRARSAGPVAGDRRPCSLFLTLTFLSAPAQKVDDVSTSPYDRLEHALVKTCA